MGFGLGPFLLVVGRCGRRLVVDDLQHAAVDELSKRLVINVGVGDLPLLIGAQMEYLAQGKWYTDRCVGLVANRLHGDSS